MKKIALGLILLFATHGVQAQFFTSCTRRKSSENYKQNVLEKAKNQELPWVTLVKEAAKIKKCPTMVEFKQSPVPTNSKAADTFHKRKFLLERGVFSNPILRGYEIIIPQPTDLISIDNNDVSNLNTFFTQGITCGEVRFNLKNQPAKKYQEGMVEIQLKPSTSENTFIFLINVPQMKIYLFLNRYKNKK